MFHLPARHDQIRREVRLSDRDLPLPNFTNPVPVSVLPSAVLDGEASGYAAHVKLARRFRDVRGVMLGRPAVYAVVIDPNGVPDPSLDRAHWEKIREWLDEQPPSSVVFLCFGSLGSFDADQVKEIASGIERSGHKFLWSLRPERRGIICGWTPQVEVLGHAAIGGFISHCGWNSILESLRYGVPIVTWPVYAEQQLNAFTMVKELGLAGELRLDYKGQGIGGHLVPAEEIEKAVGRLMGNDAAETRKKVREMREAARNAVKEDGSSYDSIGRLIQNFINSIE
ncbi:hypothetical protein EUGRSUZ_L01241 [Eucalyptus grandis]|uniref:Uncharacterized protein n=1 Tax=Eucalyptus grandis TaxID=71139 RepID=A0A058ZUK7_EUCGR|nr:hypothetical protein EUGRSUZ_L01241 [Eucalyptus grandis]